MGSIRELRNIPYLLLGFLLSSEVDSLIKGFWSLWDLLGAERRVGPAQRRYALYARSRTAPTTSIRKPESDHPTIYD